MRKTLMHWISIYKTLMMTMMICQQSGLMSYNSTTLHYLLDVIWEILNENNHLRFSMRLSYKDPRNGDQRNSLMGGVQHYGVTKYGFRGQKHLGEGDCQNTRFRYRRNRKLSSGMTWRSRNDDIEHSRSIQ